jgi:membrane protein DedA with SNARE-associated domain
VTLLSELVQTLTNFVSQIFRAFDTFGIVIIALLENLFPPTPSELIYPLAGKMAYDGNMNVIAVITAGVIGSVIGSLVLYTFGRVMGERRVRNFVKHYGQLRFAGIRIAIFPVERYDRAVKAFHKHGGRIVMIARLMPFIHGIISIPAGVVKMNRVKFVAYTAIGSLLWIGPTVMLGYLLGSQWRKVLDILDAYEYLWLGLIGIVIAYFIGTRLWILAHPHDENGVEQDIESPEQNLVMKS